MEEFWSFDIDIRIFLFFPVFYDCQLIEYLFYLLIAKIKKSRGMFSTLGHDVKNKFLRLKKFNKDQLHWNMSSGILFGIEGSSKISMANSTAQFYFLVYNPIKCLDCSGRVLLNTSTSVYKPRQERMNMRL